MKPRPRFTIVNFVLVLSFDRFVDVAAAQGLDKPQAAVPGKEKTLLAAVTEAAQWKPLDPRVAKAHEDLADYYSAEGRYADLDAMAQEFVRNQVDVIAATGGVVSAKAALRATSTIPIVFVVGFDPVALGLVNSLNAPGGNATGVSILTTVMRCRLPPRAVGILLRFNSSAGSPPHDARLCVLGADCLRPVRLLGGRRDQEAAIRLLPLHRLCR